MKTLKYLSIFAMGAGIMLAGNVFGQSLLLDEAGFLIPTNQVVPEEYDYLAFQAVGFDPATLISQITQETNGVGRIWIHAEWIATNPWGLGTNQVFNFNIYDPTNEYEIGWLSDTLSITLAGAQPGGGDPNNMTMDVEFLSEYVFGPDLTPLSGAWEFAENGMFQSVNGYLPAQFTQDSNHPLSVAFRSDIIVPEPGTVSLAVLGVGALALWRRKAKA